MCCEGGVLNFCSRFAYLFYQPSVSPTTGGVRGLEASSQYQVCQTDRSLSRKFQWLAVSNAAPAPTESAGPTGVVEYTRPSTSVGYIAPALALSCVAPVPAAVCVVGDAVRDQMKRDQIWFGTRPRLGLLSQQRHRRATGVPRIDVRGCFGGASFRGPWKRFTMNAFGVTRSSLGMDVGSLAPTRSLLVWRCRHLFSMASHRSHEFSTTFR